MKPLKRAIIICWIMLIVCFCIKLFGGNWFEIICTNEHFANLCQIIDNNKFLFHFIGWFLYVVATFWVVCSCSLLPIPNSAELTITPIVLTGVWAMQFVSNVFKSIVECVVLIVLPIVYNYIRNKDTRTFWQNFKKTWYYGIIGVALIFAFQAISLVTRNVGIKFTDDSTLVTLILLTDYYIMIVLYYLYIRLRKEVKDNNG